VITWKRQLIFLKAFESNAKASGNTKAEAFLWIVSYCLDRYRFGIASSFGIACLSLF